MQYHDTVNKVYEVAIKNFKDYLNSFKDAEAEKNAKPILIEIEYISKLMRNTLQEVSHLTSSREPKLAELVPK